ncbi:MULTISPECIES: M3 family metallopeptidase [unclassified Thioalkalivibrio]|uniref:M3 family metallopeptidase n=1 Tax=unclassified Thioalkalivibrio TaxID=2621013 RepID=UPI00035C44F4|nr:MULTISPECIES: M3 family metallopeptidase [unclassified Thioalkalivibrio]
MSNPLLQTDRLPAFRAIEPQHVLPAVETVLVENRAEIDRLVAAVGDQPTWATLIQPLQALDTRLDAVWSPVGHLNAVMNGPEIREAYNASLPLLSDYGSWVSQHQGLYRAVRRLADSEEYAQLSPQRRKVLDDMLRDFHLSGVDLPEAERDRLRAINARLSELTARFEENVLDATQAWTWQTDDAAALAGISESDRAMLAQNARDHDQTGFVVTLDIPSYLAVMTHAEDRDLRFRVYEAFTTRASDLGPGAGNHDNSEIMVEILQLREEKAHLTGFRHYAERSLATKMADSAEQVEGFLQDLAHRARPRAERDLDELRAFARDELDLGTLEAWDMAFAAEKMRERRLGLSQEMLKPYFPADRAVNGLFGLVQRLFQVRFEPDDSIETWHDDVRFYRIFDANGTERAGFYFDLYARKNKRGGAWMDVCRNRFISEDRAQLPVAYMTCNSTPPVDGKAALFTHDEVITLFHEFGHGLHHMLTRVDEPDIAGINGVEWDAVELPSQFMENWCWEREALDLFARHHESGEAMPEDLFQRLQGTRHFHAALQLLRQVEFSLFDMRLHAGPAPAKAADIQQLLDTVRQEIAVVHPPAFNRFAHGFGHIFAGGYAAGYYSYKWAEVLSADAFGRFEEEGLFSSEVGAAYLREILEAGASRPAADSFRAFRGRDPQIDALLRHSGLEEKAA